MLLRSFLKSLLLELLTEADSERPLLHPLVFDQLDEVSREEPEVELVLTSVLMEALKGPKPTLALVPTLG